ncbi:MAG: hypothetical protein H0T42_31675 [Deltaproteobacteria bacterium]|nr:hypothetical protein [Deltaproteobacteria bacterium]
MDDPDTDSVNITGFDDTAVLVDTLIMFGNQVDHLNPLDELDVLDEMEVEQMSEDTLTRQLADLDCAEIEDVSDTDRMPVPRTAMMSRAGTQPEWPPEPPPPQVPQVRSRRHKGVYAVVARPKTSNDAS